MKTSRLIGLFLVVFILGLSCSDSGREINVKQLQQRGDGLYYAVNEEKPYSGKVVELYESGQKRVERTYKNGKLHGLTTTWDYDGQKQSEVGYQNSIQSGPYRTWYDNGQQQIEGIYEEGKRKGGWKYWTKDGEERQTGTVTDIDGNSYLTIGIGGKWWMAENLKVTHYRNGDAIPNVTDDNAWSELNTGAYCSYDNDAANAQTYGYLYNWYTVNNSSSLAPEGWHVPSDAEWQTLVDYLGGNDIAGGKLKQTGTTHWQSPNEGATNESYFSALPGGYRLSYGTFDTIGYLADFWSSTKYDGHHAWFRFVYYDRSEVRSYNSNKHYGFSVRCVRD